MNYPPEFATGCLLCVSPIARYFHLFGRATRLLSHYLYWIMLLPFSLAHKDHDDRLLLEAHHRSSRRKQTVSF